MKILHLVSGDLWAGAEAVVYELVRGLMQQPEIELGAVFLNNGRLARQVEALGLPVHILDERILSVIVLVRGLRRIVRSWSPDIIHSHRYKENLLAYLASRGTGTVKLVATQHGMPEAAYGSQTLKARLRTAFFFHLLSCRFDRTVVVSHEMQQNLMSSYGFRPEHLTVIPNGISVPDGNLSEKNQRIIIGSAGRLFPVKGYELLVEIAARVVQELNEADFVLAGDGPQRADLEKAIARRGLQQRFKLLGHVDDIASFYRGLDVYINTSVHEGMPMSILEAMGHGLPVIVPKVGGFPEIVENDRQGYLIAERSPQAFADCCLRLCRDQKHRADLATRARQRVKIFFTVKEMAQKYYRLYLELLNSFGRYRVG